MSPFSSLLSHLKKQPDANPLGGAGNRAGKALKRFFGTCLAVWTVASGLGTLPAAAQPSKLDLLNTKGQCWQLNALELPEGNTVTAILGAEVDPERTEVYTKAVITQTNPDGSTIVLPSSGFHVMGLSCESLTNIGKPYNWQDIPNTPPEDMGIRVPEELGGKGEEINLTPALLHTVGSFMGPLNTKGGGIATLTSVSLRNPDGTLTTTPARVLIIYANTYFSTLEQPTDVEHFPVAVDGENMMSSKSLVFDQKFRAIFFRTVPYDLDPWAVPRAEAGEELDRAVQDLIHPQP